MNTIRELKQQEKYKTMLKRKNKEKDIYKTQNQTLRIKYEGIKKLLEKKDKEIERLNNIIDKAIEYIKNNQWYSVDYGDNILDAKEILEILKGESNE